MQEHQQRAYTTPIDRRWYRPEAVPVTESNKAVLLSYASEDAPAALRISTRLRAAGIEAWFEQNELRGGAVWD